MTSLTPQGKGDLLDPKKILEKLAENVIGQEAAKKKLAVERHKHDLREEVDEKLRAEIQPSNILMMGSTGIGKTELVRRLADILQVPVLMTEATRYSGTGARGDDLETMFTELFELAHGMVGEPSCEEKEQMEAELEAERKAEEKRWGKRWHEREMIEDGCDGSISFLPSLAEQFDVSWEGAIDRRLEIKKIKCAIELAERGIIFIDEIDKLGNSLQSARGGSVGEDVQRRLLTFLEGVTVTLPGEMNAVGRRVKEGRFRTHQVLFIAAGAFHVSKPSDLLPELLGRFPAKVNLAPLRKEDLYKILTESESSKAKMEAALLGVKGITIEFRDDGYRAIADAAAELNQWEGNLGARRLNDVVELLFHDLYFDGKKGTVIVDEKFVEKAMAERLDKAKKQREIEKGII